jgi:hypothetical protein
MIAFNSNAQNITTDIDAKTMSKLRWNEWIKVSKNRAIYTLFFGSGSSCNLPRNLTISFQNGSIVVCGNVGYHTICVADDVMYPSIYIEIDTKKHPDYAKIPIIYKRNSIEYYSGMQQDLQQWETQVYYRSQQKPEYNYDKHRKAIDNFIKNFNFTNTKLSDLKALLNNTEPQISDVIPDYNPHYEFVRITWRLLEENSCVEIHYKIEDPNIIANVRKWQF